MAVADAIFVIIYMVDGMAYIALKTSAYEAFSIEFVSYVLLKFIIKFWTVRFKRFSAHPMPILFPSPSISYMLFMLIRER